MTKKLTVGGVCSGVGGIELGFQQAGFEVRWANEIDPHACRTYRKNFKHKLYECDLGDLFSPRPGDLAPVDVLASGFPCQPFSVAGYQKGFEDDRGNIFYKIMNLVDSIQEKPKVLFLENVKNLYTHDKKRTYARIYAELEARGYSVFTDILNTASYTKIPQNRERTFIICFRNESGWEFDPKKGPKSQKFSKLFPPKPVDNPDSIDKYLEKAEVDDYYYYRQDKYMYEDLRKAIKSEDTIYQWRRVCVRENQSNQCPTLTANMGTGGHNVPLIKTEDGFRKLTPRECFNFQGYPKSFKLPDKLGRSQLYKQAGNSVTVPLIKKLALLIKETLT